MCNHIKANGEKCKNKSKVTSQEYCHIHENKISKREKILQDIVKLQQQQNIKHEEEIKLIATVNKRNGKLYEDLLKKYNDLVDVYKSTEEDLIEAHEPNIKNSKLFDVTKNEVKNLNKTLEKKVLIIKYKDEEIKALMKVNKELEEDAKNYKIIKEYELEKQELINKGIDIYNYKNEEWHQKRYLRNQLSHPKCF